MDEEPSKKEDEEAGKNAEKNVHFQSTQTDDYLENKSNGSTNSSSSASCNGTKKSSASSSGCVKSVKFAEDNCSKVTSVTHLINATAATLGLVNNTSSPNDTHSNSSCNSNKNQSDFQSSSSLEENSSLELEPNDGVLPMPEAKPVTEYALKPLFSNDQYKLLQQSAAHHSHESKNEPLNRKLINKPQHQLSREDLSHKKKFESKPIVCDDKRLNGKKPTNGQHKVESRPAPLETNTSNESQRSPKPVWKNDPQHLIKNTCNFSVQVISLAGEFPCTLSAFDSYLSFLKSCSVPWIVCVNQAEVKSRPCQVHY